MSTTDTIKSLRALVNLSVLLGASGFTVTAATTYGSRIEVHLDRDGTPAVIVAETLSFEDVEATDVTGSATTLGDYTVVHARWRGWDVTMFGPQVVREAVA